MSDNSTFQQQHDWDSFINKLGFVYYAMAEANGKTSGDDMEQLKKTVQRIWSRYSGIFTGYQGYHANKTEALFDWLNLNETDWKFCMNEFSCFLTEKPDFVTSGIRQAILDTATEVSAALGETDNAALKELRGLLLAQPAFHNLN
jgi:hypothetical protein